MNNYSLQLSILIVNYNSATYVLECIRSLQKQLDIRFELILIDNASNDNSVALLQGNLPENCFFIENKENIGFGRANNLAANKASGEYLLILNPDTVIDDPYAIKNLLDTLVQNPKVGLLAPLILEPRKNKQVLPRYSYPSSRTLKYTHKLEALPGKIAWVLGACMLIKHSVYDEIKGFDPDYFLYGEDADICLKVRIAGYEIGYSDAVKITHVGGVSELSANTFDKWLRKKRGVYLFFRKHFDSRDATRVARTAIIKSKLYLVVLRLMGLFQNQESIAFEDKRHRLQATIIVAKELLKSLNSKF